MKSNNQYLEKINESVGGQVVDERKPNNWYLRSIANNTGSQEIHGHRTDNYYLKRIALNMEDLDVKELLETIAELRDEVERLEGMLDKCCRLLVVRFNGKTISQSYNTTYFVGDNVVIDWGDGTTTDYTTGGYSHTYEEDGEHTITISNVTGLVSSFANNDGVVGVTIPNTVTSITYGAFQSTGLSDVFIPPSVTTLGRGAFNLSSLTNVTLSEGLETIDGGCFTGCVLSEITIPKSVKNINGVYLNLEYMNNINLLWDTSETIIPYNSDIYYYNYGDWKFTIPTGTTSLYEAKGYPSSRLQER